MKILFLRSNIAYPEKLNAVISAIEVPKKELDLKPDTIIRLTPKPATSIAIKVRFETLSFNKILAKSALINGIEARIKSVAATVVLVIACIKHIPAKAKKIPARTPDQPTAVIFIKV